MAAATGDVQSMKDNKKGDVLERQSKKSSPKAAMAKNTIKHLHEIELSEEQETRLDLNAMTSLPNKHCT